MKYILVCLNLRLGRWIVAERRALEGEYKAITRPVSWDTARSILDDLNIRGKLRESSRPWLLN